MSAPTFSIFQFSLLHNAGSSCIGFRVLFQQKQSDSNVIFSVVRHAFSILCVFSVSIVYQKEREKQLSTKFY